MVVEEFERDIRRPNPRYRDLISGNRAPDQVLANLKHPALWDRQSVRLVPYVAARLSGLELGIMGADGAILPVSDVTGPRVRDPNGRPILLVRVGDRHFVQAVPVPVSAEDASTDDTPDAAADAAPADGAHDAAAQPPEAIPGPSRSASRGGGWSARRARVPRCHRTRASPTPLGGWRRCGTWPRPRRGWSPRVRPGGASRTRSGGCCPGHAGRAAGARASGSKRNSIASRPGSRGWSASMP